MGLTNHAYFQVATKVLLRDNDKILVLETPDGYLDFPGGRVDKTEQDLPWREALAREISEEIGDAVRYQLGQTAFVSKRTYHWGYDEPQYIALIFFEGEYQGGDITISDEHDKYHWLTAAELLASDLKFISEYEQNELNEYLTKS